MRPMLLQHSAVLQVHMHPPQGFQGIAKGGEELLLGGVQPIHMEHIVVCLHTSDAVNHYHVDWALRYRTSWSSSSGT